MMARFEIDFFEFSFLVEACIPKRPIARTMFWHNVIDKYFHEMTPSERAKLFDWIYKNPQFDRKKEDCDWFYHRFNPLNQYTVTTKYGGKIEEQNAFKFNDMFYIRRNVSILDKYIINIEQIPPPEDF